MADNHFKRVLQNIQELNFRNETHFPKNWRQTLQILFWLGLAGMTVFWLCDSPDHAYLFEKGVSFCPKCNASRTDCATQAALSIKSTLSQELKSPLTALKLTEYLSYSHCNPFPATYCAPDVMQNPWDGKRVYDMKWFLDPRESWPLPEQCPRCQRIVLYDEVATCRQNDAYLCPNCGYQFPGKNRQTFGDPCNILIRLWTDAMPLWKGCTESIDVTLWDFTLLAKQYRTQSFLFLHSIRKQSKNSKEKKIRHTAIFQEKLCQELADLFVNGLIQDWPVDMPEYNIAKLRGAGKPIRVMLSTILGDCAALYETGAFRVGTCFVCGAKPDGYDPHARRYYYTHFNSYPNSPDEFLNLTIPWEKLQQNASYVEKCSFQYKDMAKKTFHCNGYSPFWDLVRLYQVDEKHMGLDLSRDIQFDVMHVLLCRGIIQSVQAKYNQDLGDNKHLPKALWKPITGGVRSQKDKEALDLFFSEFPKTVNIRAARFPNNPSQYMARFKACEVLFFTRISEVACEELPEPVQKHWLQLRKITLALCSPQITTASINELYSSLQEWASLHEEFHGIRAGIPKLHFLFHIIASIKLWSVPSLNWCFAYEGKLGYYQKLLANRNGKNIHHTLVSNEAVAHFLRIQNETRIFEILHNATRDQTGSALLAELKAQKIHGIIVNNKLVLTHVSRMDLTPRVTCLFVEIRLVRHFKCKKCLLRETTSRDFPGSLHTTRGSTLEILCSLSQQSVFPS